MKLENPSLFRQQALIGGKWCQADDDSCIQVRNPFDGSLLGSIPNLGGVETRRAVEAAEQALPSWRNKTGKERGAIIKKWQALIEQNLDDLAMILTLEQGKPLAEAQGELRYALSFVEWFGEEAKRIYGDYLPTTNPDQRMLVMKQPVGVCAALIAWNFPSALVTRKVTPALAAGCTVVLKPSELTPYTALALAYLAELAGFPAGVLNVVTGQPASIGQELTRNPVIRKLTFTGSTETGKLLMQQSASNIKKLSLELGGNAPFIVFDDADIDSAVLGLMQSKFRNAGQTCVCANRVYLHETIAEAFIEKLLVAVQDLRPGNGLDPDSTIGPLINQRAVDKITELVSDALSKGARLLLRHGEIQEGSLMYPPTILDGITPDMRIANEEIFGPVISLFRFASEVEVITLANDNESGLAAYFYTNNQERIWRLMEALEYGVVGINTGMVSNEVGPFGGMKTSGIGREGSKYGIEEFLEIKYACLANQRLAQSLT